MAGATGNVGSRAVRELLALGFKVRGFCRLCASICAESLSYKLLYIAGGYLSMHAEQLQSWVQPA